MLEYYKNKMNEAHKKYQEAVDGGKEKLADKLMADYLNYEEMFNEISAKS